MASTAISPEVELLNVQPEVNSAPVKVDGGGYSAENITVLEDWLLFVFVLHVYRLNGGTGAAPPGV